MEYTENNGTAEGIENVENKKHDDTEKLLRECNAGIKMGISSIDEVLPSVHDGRLKGILENSRREHADLGDEALDVRVGDGALPAVDLVHLLRDDVHGHDLIPLRQQRRKRHAHIPSTRYCNFHK